MKRSHLYTLSAMIAACILLAGCRNEAKVSEPVLSSADIAVITPAPDAAENDSMPDPDIPEADSQDETSAEASDEEVSDEKASGEDKEDNLEVSGSNRTIVWLGDSLTQGSLGEEDDNIANAPYVKLQSLVSNKVEGYGLYGYRTHDILETYRSKEPADPDKIYIFWVGSNDWCQDFDENTNTVPVIDEVDRFLLENGLISDYIFIGTTQRWRLGLDRALKINTDLEARYGEHYLDVIDIIEANGFAPDNTHLSQASYDAIASAVRDKLKALGYI